MKRIKYTLFFCLCILGIMSCTDEDAKNPENLNGVKILLSIPETATISPMSKSSLDNVETISNYCVLIYEEKNSSTPIVSDYFDQEQSSGQIDGLTNSSQENPQPFSYPLKDGKYNIRVVVNAGDLSSGSMEEVDRMTFGFTNNNTIQYIMYGTGECTVSEGKSNTLSIPLKRIYSKITVMVNTKGLDESITITPTKVLLKHVPSEGGFLPNRIKNTSVKEPFEGNEVDLASDEGVDSENSGRMAIFSDGSASQDFYMYENMQPLGTYSTEYDGKWLSVNSSPALGFDKTPASFSNGPIADKAIVMSDKTCSYIEVYADYQAKDKNDNLETTGTVTYRFFLGNNPRDNFEIERNYNYLITLNVGGKGAVNEVSWRVDTDLNPDFITSDVYLSYYQGAKGGIKIEGKGYNISSLSVKPSGGSDNISAQDYQGSGKSFTIPVSTSKANIRLDTYEEKYYTITASFKGISKTVTKTVKVSQVSRLVDPIAIYRKAQNYTPEEVKIKEYKRGDDDYHILSSNGPWSVEIEKGDWFTISRNNTTINKGEVLTENDGGEITFTYTPNADYKVPIEDGSNDNEARYGVILVKYHNLNCEHRVYVREGYHPTTFGNTTWSMFNTIGNGEFTSYPTQTGDFYRYGNTAPIHPFKGGYKGDQIFSTSSSGGSHCPSGYTLPTEIMCKSLGQTYSFVQGFVHDDDPEGGWYRSGKAPDNLIFEDQSENNYHCNPAKGTLVVEEETGKSIFFNYGKGVMTGHNMLDRPNIYDINLNEIGIGARNTDGRLMYYFNDNINGEPKDKYGAYYLVNYFSGKRFDLWYAMTDPGKDTKQSLVSQIGNDYASFVRCVRDKSGGGSKPEEPEKPAVGTKILAKFLSWSNQVREYTSFTGDIVISIGGYDFTIKIKNGVAIGEYQWLNAYSSYDKISLKSGYFLNQFNIGNLLTEGQEIKFMLIE